MTRTSPREELRRTSSLASFRLDRGAPRFCVYFDLPGHSQRSSSRGCPAPERDPLDLHVVEYGGEVGDVGLERVRGAGLSTASGTGFTRRTEASDRQALRAVWRLVQGNMPRVPSLVCSLHMPPDEKPARVFDRHESHSPDG